MTRTDAPVLPWWIDRRRVLDVWRDAHQRTVTLYGLTPPLDREGYAAVQARLSGDAPKILLLLRDGDTLASVPDGAEDRVLRQRLSRASGRRRRAGDRGMSAVGALVALLVLAGCGIPAGEREALQATEQAEAVEGSEAESSPSPWERFPPAEQCPVVAPRELPSGADPGQPREFPEDDPMPHMLAWGTGKDEVTLGRGRELFADAPPDLVFPPADWPDRQTVHKDGVDRYVVPVGDPPLGVIRIEFLYRDCPYVLWMQSGHELEEAMDHAARF
jgi:hypothetical protein